MKANIYVQIPAYRDRELVPTLESLFREAAAPERLRVAVAWQFGPEEAHLERTLRSRSNVEVHAIPAAESLGCNWARSLLQERWDGEPYTLLLDSHHRFVPGWDTQVVTLFEEVRSAGIAKPLLTSYLPPYDPRLEPAGRGSGLLQIQLLERLDGMMFRLVGHPVHNGHTVTAPFPAHFTSLHFLFTSGAFNDEVPFDASIYFFADEVAIALRAFTHGYELLHPHCSLGWHLYDRATRVTHWTDHGTWRGGTRCRRSDCGRCIAGGSAGRYGIGEDRTIGDYEAHIGLPLITPDTRHR